MSATLCAIIIVAYYATLAVAVLVVKPDDRADVAVMGLLVSVMVVLFCVMGMVTS